MRKYPQERRELSLEERMALYEKEPRLEQQEYKWSESPGAEKPRARRPVPMKRQWGTN